MVAVFGATYKPTVQQLKYADKMANAFGLSTDNVSWRRGGIYQGIMSLMNNKRDVTWGNNVATYGSTSSKTFGHEFGHIIQINKQGWARFQAIGIFEQLFIGNKVYRTPGTNEYGANKYLYQYGKN